jgi:hypothetical protein
MTDPTETSPTPAEGRSYTTPEGYTLRVCSSMYIDWGLSIRFAGFQVFYGPCCLSAESYGRKPNPAYGFEDWDEAEASDQDDAFIPWSDEDWRECLQEEADTFIEAYIGDDAFEVVTVEVTLLDKEGVASLLIMLNDERTQEIIQSGREAWWAVKNGGFPVYEVTTFKVPTLWTADLQSSREDKEVFWTNLLWDQRALMPDEDIFDLNQGDDWHTLKVPLIFLTGDQHAKTDNFAPSCTVANFTDRGMTLRVSQRYGPQVTALCFAYRTEWEGERPPETPGERYERLSGNVIDGDGNVRDSRGYVIGPFSPDMADAYGDDNNSAKEHDHE